MLTVFKTTGFMGVGTHMHHPYHWVEIKMYWLVALYSHTSASALDIPRDSRFPGGPNFQC